MSFSIKLERQEVEYCGACGMPPEYCEYSPDFETHCNPWLKKANPELHAKLNGSATEEPLSSEKEVSNKPSRPWTTEERLVAFYEQYVPEKVDGAAALLVKYAGKEDKLFQALIKKYGPEPLDPYFADSDSEGDDSDLEEKAASLSLKNDGASEKGNKKKRRGVGAKKKGSTVESSRVVVQKVARNKKRILTVVVGMESVPDVKLKDVSKAFSKRFAGSSSVKDGIKGKEIIIQGDHMYDVAEMIVDKFGVPESSVFLDMDGEVVPLR